MKNAELVATLKAGHYRLSRDVTNPEPDRRCTREWRSFPVWKAGTRIYVRISERQSPIHPDDSYIETQLEFSDARYPGLSRITPYDERFEPLVSALEPIEEDLDLLKKRLDHGGSFLLECLYLEGKVSLADIEEAAEKQLAKSRIAERVNR